MRCFLAIDLPEEARQQVSELQAHLRAGRKVPEENLHLTLAFLDDQPDYILEDLNAGLSELQFDPFDLILSGLDMFGGKRPRVLFLRALATPALSDLHRRVKQALREVGIEMPRERFRPHVTLARFRRDLIDDDTARIGGFLAARGDAVLPPFEVTQISLFGSTLHPEGAVHEVLATYPARG
ncbi:2'-5' RNA ligase [Shimia gijangensis]|uniref:RNA 2',3'-cyclic phosphodiesterase n=1 Tax=Shimia gijangensis TaxID=1470563 RepID=A0A1M6IEU7_9RHOB|nr:RNA 2',3'-cyclic phosphodiesterase [Shimia gijangensis]SHJ32958.1 2'-5' RNA ligase [Shimia gijangensis]